MIRSARDPARRSTPLESWPSIDRQLWSTAREPGDVIDEEGRAARWADATCAARANAYGRWLTFLARDGALDPAAHPADRPTPERVQRYTDLLRASCSSMTVWSQVDRLHAMLSALSPEREWAWLRRIVNRLNAMAGPVRPIESRLRPARELFDEGVRRARLAERSADLSATAQAVAFRDGLMVALLAACPIRRRSFAALTIDQHLVRHQHGDRRAGARAAHRRPPRPSNLEDRRAPLQQGARDRSGPQLPQKPQGVPAHL